MTTDSYARAIENHYARTWSPPIKGARWNVGPVKDLPESFEILVFKKTEDVTVYATSSMSQPLDAERVELHLLTKAGDSLNSDIIEIMTAIAHYHRTGKRLALSHTVSFGKPWFANSGCAHGVISLPYLDGPALEWLETPRVRFLWLVPITDAEVQYKKARGVEMLEQKFEQVRFDYLDPHRASVV